jgi:hypothetical protein
MAETKTKKTEKVEEPVALDPWQGPFAEYQIVVTPVGEYAIEAFQILDFTSKQVVNKKTFEIETQYVPFYRPATDEELERANLKDAKNFRLPSAHPDKQKAAFDADKTMKDRISRNTAQVDMGHRGSTPGYAPE